MLYTPTRVSINFLRGISVNLHPWHKNYQFMVSKMRGFQRRTRDLHAKGQKGRVSHRVHNSIKNRVTHQLLLLSPGSLVFQINIFKRVYIYTSGFKHVSLRRFKFQSVWDYHFDLINDYLKINKLTRLQHQFTYLMSHDSHNSCILYIWKVRANFVRT